MFNILTGGNVRQKRAFIMRVNLGFVPPCRVVNAPASLLGVEQRVRRNLFYY